MRRALARSRVCSARGARWSFPAPGAPADGAKSRSRRLGAAVFAAGLCVPGAAIWCEDCELKLTTYNVLSPCLATPQQFPTCAKEDLAKDFRLPKVMRRLQKDVADERIIALQEVDLEWAGKLHAFFAEHNYAVVFAQYGKTFNGYMGVMLAWPTKRYEAVDVDICRLADTAPKGACPKTPAPTIAKFGYLTYQGLTEILGCRPPEVPGEPGDEWKLALSRFNEAIFVKLKPRGFSGAFCVGTYHMPCLFGSTEKIRAVNIHSRLLLSRLQKFAAGVPVALMGDFNIKPDTSSYDLIVHGGIADKVRPEAAAEVAGLERLPKADFPKGLQSAYKAFYGQEPAFTNYALSGSNSEPFIATLDYIWYSPERLRVVACQQLPAPASAEGPLPNAQEPSDHLPLHATFRMSDH